MVSVAPLPFPLAPTWIANCGMNSYPEGGPLSGERFRNLPQMFIGSPAELARRSQPRIRVLVRPVKFEIEPVHIQSTVRAASSGIRRAAGSTDETNAAGMMAFRPHPPRLLRFRVNRLERIGCSILKRLDLPIAATTGFLLVTALIGCPRKPESQAVKQQPSPIVQKAESNGAGDLSNTSAAAMKAWFSNHPDVALDIQKNCEPIQAKAPASWNDSVEGRVCQAASEAAASNGPPFGEHGRMEGIPPR